MPMTSHKRVIQPVNEKFRIQVVVVNQPKELESEGPKIKGNGLKDLLEVVEVQKSEPIIGVMNY